jgi:NADPH2:quinone reductase
MRAVFLRGFGSPDQLALEATPAPVPGPDQLLIEVAAAGITFVETQLRAGNGPFQWELPVIPGNGVGGSVIAVGADIDAGLVGSTVVGPTGGAGGYAELAAVNSADAIAVPPGVDLRDAVALLADGRTAIGLMRAAEPVAGEWVLVESAAGGVGGLLVQLAKASGARVIGAAGGSAKLQHAHKLGAEATVDYRMPDWPDRVRSIAGGVDVVFDGVGGDIGAAAFGLLRPGGRLCVLGMAGGPMSAPAPEALAAAGVRLLPLGEVFTGRAQLRQLAEAALAAAAAGELRPTIGQTFPLERAAEAHAAIESRRTLGKTLLIP